MSATRRAPPSGSATPVALGISLSDDDDFELIPTGYKCRRCGKECGLDEGSTDLEGLCGCCWTEVDAKLRS